MSLICVYLVCSYPDETWHEDYFGEYYELVRKQQEEEYNYTYDYSFTSTATISLVQNDCMCDSLELMHLWYHLCLDNSEDFDKTFDEDEVELLPPATPSKDGDDTIEVIGKWF